MRGEKKKIKRSGKKNARTRGKGESEAERKEPGDKSRKEKFFSGLKASGQSVCERREKREKRIAVEVAAKEKAREFRWR